MIEEIIAALERRMDGSITPWILQAWHLWKADLLALMGRRSEAVDIARAGLARFGSAPLASSFTGALDRWLVLACDPGEPRWDVKLLISTHLERLTEFDALDQIEILCGALRVAETGTDRLEAERALQERIQTTPIGVINLMRRLEFLPPESWTAGPR
jgi:hypothetical protein